MNKLIIQLQDYNYDCADGCCTEYGTKIIVNDEALHEDGYSIANALYAVLKHLGYEVVIENVDENGEPISELR